MRSLLMDTWPSPSGREQVLTRCPIFVPLGAFPHDRRVYTAICEVPRAFKDNGQARADCMLCPDVGQWVEHPLCKRRILLPSNPERLTTQQHIALFRHQDFLRSISKMRPSCHRVARSNQPPAQDLGGLRKCSNGSHGSRNGQVSLGHPAGNEDRSS
jgi:hypothetical protein